MPSNPTDKLFMMIDQINQLINRLESDCILNVVRGFTHDNWGIRKCAGKWRIVLIEGESCKPVRDCPMEDRIAFAEIATGFMAAYGAQAEEKMSEMERRAEAAIQDMQQLFSGGDEVPTA